VSNAQIEADIASVKHSFSCYCNKLRAWREGDGDLNENRAALRSQIARMEAAYESFRAEWPSSLDIEQDTDVMKLAQRFAKLDKDPALAIPALKHFDLDDRCLIIMRVIAYSVFIGIGIYFISQRT
jgi:hypothetical protein